MQLGSLGSGNHFIEVSLDEDDRVWLFLHSGSRGVGNKLAQRSTSGGRRSGAARGASRCPTATSPTSRRATPEFDAYIEELRWAQRFALPQPRGDDGPGRRPVGRFLGAPVERVEVINCHHNYTERETHYGREVWLSRKGAIAARAGQRGLIPGSMGTASYVVVGRGNPESLMSVAARRRAELLAVGGAEDGSRGRTSTAMAGIECRDTDAFLDEIPAAYKPIDQVMADAADLVEVRHTLRQVVNVKGD